MFDSDRPWLSGHLAGESFAATLENHARYPTLRRERDRAMIERCDGIVAGCVDGELRTILLELGFDEAGIAIYRAAALKAFRAVRPNI